MVDSLFTAQTRGIKHRSKIYKNAWMSHLENSKQAIRDTFLEDLKRGKTLSVLGCGELLDFPSDIFSEFKRQIYLIDKSKEALSKFIKNTILYDLTGSLNSWSSYLQDLKTNDITSFLNEVKNLPQKLPLLSSPSFKDELVLSLNLMSQLPVYWQDSVYNILNNKFSRQLVKDAESDILKALTPSSQALITSHLQSLIPKGRHKKSLLISDTHYIYPKEKNAPIKDVSSSLQELNLQSESALDKIEVEVMDALHGITIEQNIGGSCTQTLINKWLWEIVPNKINHRVVALLIHKGIKN